MNTHEQLIAQIQAEASGDVPAFSESLHRRVMAAVRQTLSPAPGTPGEGWGGGQSAISWGFAAAAAIALGIGITLLNPPAATQTQIVRHEPPIPIPSIPVITLADAAAPADRTLHDARFAYLDRDAKSFGKFLISQIDVLPPNQ